MPCGVQDARDRRTTDAVAHVLQRALNPRVAPRRILGRHPNHQRSKMCLQASAPAAAATDRSTCAPPARGASAESCPASRSSRPARAGADRGDDPVRPGVAARGHRNAGAAPQAAPSGGDSLREGTRSGRPAHDAASQILPDNDRTITRESLMIGIDSVVGHHGARKGQRAATRDQRPAKVVEFPKGIGSSGWTRTSNPPVNRLTWVLYLVGSSVV